MRRLIGLDLIDLGILFCAGLIFAFVMSGCALSTTAAGATTAQKLKADMSAIAQVETDVKVQCGQQFAPIAAVAASILSVAEGVAAASSGNIAGALSAAMAAFPAIYADAKALKCVYDAVEADYQKFKPHATLESPVARAQLFALVTIPPICDSGTTEAIPCRAVTVDDDFPLMIDDEHDRLAKSPCPLHDAKASAHSSPVIH